MEIKKNKITAILGLNTDINIEEEILERIFETSVTLNDYLSSKFKDLSHERISEALKICLLKEDCLNKKLNIFSSSEIEKVELMIKLLQNKDMIILSDFENNLGLKELKYFKILFKKMVQKYGKTVVFITSDCSDIMDIIDYILVVENKNVVLELSSKDIYFNKIYEYADMPSIIKTTKLLKKKNIDIEGVYDIGEIAKIIYRGIV